MCQKMQDKSLWGIGITEYCETKCGAILNNAHIFIVLNLTTVKQNKNLKQF